MQQLRLPKQKLPQRQRRQLEQRQRQKQPLLKREQRQSPSLLAKSSACSICDGSWSATKHGGQPRCNVTWKTNVQQSVASCGSVLTWPRRSSLTS